MSLLGADGFDLHPNGTSPSSLDGVFTRSATSSACISDTGDCRVADGGGTSRFMQLQRTGLPRR